MQLQQAVGHIGLLHQQPVDHIGLLHRQPERETEGGNRETTASVESVGIRHVEVSKSSGQPSLGTAVVTCSRVLKT